jgi:hypothetical protein
MTAEPRRHGLALGLAGMQGHVRCDRPREAARRERPSAGKVGGSIASDQSGCAQLGDRLNVRYIGRQRPGATGAKQSVTDDPDRDRRAVVRGGKIRPERGLPITAYAGRARERTLLYLAEQRMVAVERHEDERLTATVVLDDEQRRGSRPRCPGVGARVLAQARGSAARRVIRRGTRS